MVGSPAGVEVVAKKVRRKIFQQRQGVLTTVEDFYDEGGIAKKELRHQMGCQKRKHGEVLTHVETKRRRVGRNNSLYPSLIH